MVVRGSAWLAASWTSRRGTPGLERSSNEGVPQGVRTDTLGDPRLSGHATSLTGPAHEDRALETLANRQVEGPGNPRPERDGHDLAALARHRQGRPDLVPDQARRLSATRPPRHAAHSVPAATPAR